MACMELEHFIAWLIVVLQVPTSLLTHKMLSKSKGEVKEVNPFLRFLMRKVGVGRALLISFLATPIIVYLFMIFPPPINHLTLGFMLGVAYLDLLIDMSAYVHMKPKRTGLSTRTKDPPLRTKS